MTDRLRVVLMVGPRGEGLETLLAYGSRSADYTVVGALVTAPESTAIPVLERYGIPWVCHDIRAFYRERQAPIRDLRHRADYDRGSLRHIEAWAPTHLVLFRYIYIVSPVLLEAFPKRVLNVHDGDLTQRDATGRPLYPGLHATRDAILDGVTATRSTVHIVTEEVDMGPPVLLSPPYPVYRPLVRRARRAGALDVLKAYAYAHREWMIRDGWGKLIHATLTLWSRAPLRVLGDRVFWGDRPGPWVLRSYVARRETAVP
jgi:folate-dependent phosphoribosylglycinamide formyltransferase PurN